MKFIPKIIACLAISTIAAGAFFSSANALTETYKVTDLRDNSIRIKTTNMGNNIETGLIKISNEKTGFIGMTYCTNRVVSLNTKADYIYSSWTESGVPQVNQLGRVVGVLKNSYPTKSISEIQALSGIANLTEEEAMAAAQAGITYFSNNTETHKIFDRASSWKKAKEITSGDKRYDNIMALYSYYKNNASNHPKPKNIQNVTTKITQPTEDLFTNQKAFVTFTSSDNSDISVKANQDFEFFYKNDDSVVDLNTVKSGEEIYFTSPTAKGDLQLTFNQKNMNYPMGTVFVGADGIKTQQIILAEDVISKEDTTATISWSEDGQSQVAPTIVLPATSNSLVFKALAVMTIIATLIGLIGIRFQAISKK